MLNKIINLSIANKLIVVLLTLFIVGFGIFSIMRISLGAVPDITNNQVQVITTSTSLSTQDVEQFITYPVELEMSNLPGVTEIRSISKFGLSVVTIVFEDRLGTYLPRQLIAEKIKTASSNIPEGFGTPEMGPISTGLGEIYQYVLDIKPGYEDKYSIMELRTIQTWLMDSTPPQLRATIFGIYFGLSMEGMSLAQPVAGHFMDIFGITEVFYFIALISLGLSVAALIFIKGPALRRFFTG